MTSSKERIYQLETRQAQAAQTRGRILDSAKQLFHSAGFDKVIIDQLAKAANVSTPTVYALFRSKRGVPRALMDEALPPAQFEALVGKVKHEKLLGQLLIKTLIEPD